MKLLYAHDHRLRYFNEHFYTTGGFSDQVTARYTTIFGKMILMCRATKTDKVEGCTRISNGNVEVCPIFCGKVLPTNNNIRLIKEEVTKADVVMVRLPSLMGLYTAIIAFDQKKRVCVEVVGSAWGSYWFKSISGKVSAFPLEIFNKYIVKKASYVLYVTDDYLQKEYPTTGTSVGCSDVVLGDRDIGVLNNRLALIKKKTENNFVLGTLGQIDYRYKGHETVIQAIAKLKNQGLKFEYRLAGSGSRDYIEKLASKYGVLENIKFCGQIKHSEINRWFSELDIYIQPSLTEGMPRSVIEALYMALPIVASDAGGMYELIEPSYMFRKGNVEDLIRILATVNNEKLQEMAKRNYYFAEKFDCLSLQEKRNAFYKMIKGDGIR